MNRIALSSIALLLANVASAQVAEVFNPSEPVVSVVAPLNPSSGVSPAGAPACGGQLFNNGAFVTSTGNGAGGANLSTLQTTSLGMGTLGFGHQAGTANNRVTDDFVVPAGGWTLNCAVFYAYQTGSTTTSTITAVNVRIWNGPPGAMGSSIVFGDTTTNRMSTTAWTNVYRVTEETATDTTRPIMAQTINLGGLNLAAGTYWIDWQTTGSLASGPWAPPISIIGQAVTGNGQQFTGNTSAWAPAVDGGTGTPAQGLPFLLLGPVGTPTLSLSGTSVNFGNVVSGQTGTSTVTLSNTGTASLSITALTAPTAPFALTGGTCGATPITLAPAASCTLIYRFAPSSAGNFSQTFALTSNGGNASFTLQGSGAVPQPAVVPASGAISQFLLALLTLGIAGWAFSRRR
ncbi:MAG: choice-of-anchor D domain-containing protein [Xanthomonadales bacterium]|nr:choice-of-anchor D domain-containing protein [Xanthomonadales bacterium]